MAFVVSPAIAWYGPSDYNLKAFINFGEWGAGAAVADDITMRFTARTNETIGQIKMMTDSASSYAGTPSGIMGIYADDGAGNPGLALGVTAAPVAIPGGAVFTGVLANTVTLVPGNVYHVRLTSDAAVGEGDNCRLRCGQLKADLDQRTYDKANDSNLAGMFYLHGDLVYPDGWYEGRRAEFTKVWDPIFGLYDEQGNPLSEGEGADSRYNDRNNYYKKPFVDNSFILHDTSITSVDKIPVYVTKKNAPGDLKVRLLAAGGTEITSAQVASATIATGWNEIAVPAASVIPNQRYILVQETIGESSYGNRFEPTVLDYDGFVPHEASWYGTEAYGVQSEDSGATYGTITQNKEWLIQIPEPATLSLLVIGGIAVLGRKRR